MGRFFDLWGKSALTALGFFWMALWAFALGYTISSMIQVFVTRQRMKQTMGERGWDSVGLGAFFGFISSSCSFAALSTARSIFQKGAGLVPALAFLLASTNLVIELGIVILVFLSWQFAVAEYVGGVLLILVMWITVKLTLPENLEEEAREHAKKAGDGSDEDVPNWKKLIKSLKGWRKTARRYFMEWKMVWKDVTIGFTVAGIIAVFVPKEFFQAMFIGSGAEGGAAWWQIALHSLIGPVAAFFTFIGSMGNIPLAGVLFSSGVSFAGIMAFIFSDLVVFPVLRISARYFGWKMAFYILGVFLICIIVSSLSMHAGFGLIGMLPDQEAVKAAQMGATERFKIDYTFFLNIGFVLLSLGFAWLGFFSDGDMDEDSNDDSNGEDGNQDSREGNASDEDSGEDQSEENESDEGSDNDGDSDEGEQSDWMRRTLLVIACVAIAWLVCGTFIYFLT